MVSLWPWKQGGEDAASFEKALSALQTKITKNAAKNDTLRQRSRRVRVMWTLYAGFAYILIAVLLILVTGWRNWGPTEISVVAGGPVLIYLVRTSLTTYYEYRISKTQAYLDSLHKERDATIERLKTATKYNSTQQLLEKYGSPSPQSKQKQASSQPDNRRKSGGTQKQAQQQGPRTNIAPPPTANIQRPPAPGSRPGSAGAPQQAQLAPPPLNAAPIEAPPSAEFAPNAFDPTTLNRQYSSSTITPGHWYDRILDALLGEDETQPKNRLALICSECRLVNGQAPPGTRTLEDVGRWRCGGCHAWNGKENVKEETVSALVQEWEEERRVKEAAAENASFEHAGSGIDDQEDSESDDTGSGAADAIESVEAEDEPPARSTRSKSKVKGKKK